LFSNAFPKCSHSKSGGLEPVFSFRGKWYWCGVHLACEFSPLRIAAFTPREPWKTLRKSVRGHLFIETYKHIPNSQEPLNSAFLNCH
jgi:hypothetical protein